MKCIAINIFYSSSEKKIPSLVAPLGLRKVLFSQTISVDK